MTLSIEEIISEIRDQWMNIDGVEGVSQSKIDDKDCILVLVREKTPEIEKSIPAEFKGFTVRVMDIGGYIRAQ
jgi:hypothetical protein